MPRLIHFRFLFPAVLELLALEKRDSTTCFDLTFTIAPRIVLSFLRLQRAQAAGLELGAAGDCKLQAASRSPRGRTGRAFGRAETRRCSAAGGHRHHHPKGNARRASSRARGGWGTLTVLLLVAGELQLTAQVGLRLSAVSLAGQGRCQQEKAEEEHLADCGESSLAAGTGEAATPSLSPPPGVEAPSGLWQRRVAR
jgi:hypothetical protein